MVTFQRVPVLTGSDDREGCAIFLDGALAAVIVQLDLPEHGRDRGKWFLEAGFGPCAGSAELFQSAEAAMAWVAERVAR